MKLFPIWAWIQTIAVSLAAFLGTAAHAQAPVSLAGYTLRTTHYTAQEYGPVSETYWIDSVDFFPDGSFTSRFQLMRFFSGVAVYQNSVHGSYAYSQTSATTANLTFSPSIIPDGTLTFANSNQGTFAYQPNIGPLGDPSARSGSGTTTFSLLPTGGTPGTRALVNMSAMVSASQVNPIVFGFVVSAGTPWREILVRAVGPSLQPFGIQNFAANPVYLLNGYTHVSDYPTDSPNILLPGENGTGENGGQGWNASSQSAATITAENLRGGAFALSPGSTDKADVFLLPPGSYTITVAPTDPSQEGVELVEVYEIQ